MHMELLLVGKKSVPVKGDGIGVIALLGITVRYDVFILDPITILQVGHEPDHCLLELGRIGLAASMDHLDANAVVVVYAGKSLEDIDVHRGKVRVDSLINAAVAIDHILRAGMSSPQGAPGVN